MPRNVVFKSMNALHRAALTLSGGRLGWTAMKMPVVELATTGRKSGERRTVMLTSPVHDDGTYVVVASRGGDGVTPAWFLNLRATPAVEVTNRGERTAMRARVLEGEERAAMWERVVTDFPHYGGYQEKAGKDIPLVLLVPVTPTDGVREIP